MVYIANGRGFMGETLEPVTAEAGTLITAEQNVSYEWFRKTFMDVMGISPGRYLLNLKIEKTGQMLRETSLTIAEIKAKAGFESKFYFSRIFKKKTGYTPSVYRKKS